MKDEPVEGEEERWVNEEIERVWVKLVGEAERREEEKGLDERERVEIML